MRVSSLLLVSVILLVAGCGGAADLPELGNVSGVVTLDGEPLNDAGVTFQGPDGRLAFDRTDANGSYSLIFLNEDTGAVVGKNNVFITTSKPGSDDVPGSAVKESLPARYNEKSELTAEVQARSNTFNFDLKSM